MAPRFKDIASSGYSLQASENSALPKIINRDSSKETKLMTCFKSNRKGISPTISPGEEVSAIWKPSELITPRRPWIRTMSWFAGSPSEAKGWSLPTAMMRQCAPSSTRKLSEQPWKISALRCGTKMRRATRCFIEWGRVETSCSILCRSITLPERSAATRMSLINSGGKSADCRYSSTIFRIAFASIACSSPAMTLSTKMPSQ
mmetsp:Transcript_26555/g.66832  ORF Transcript_26555/g.66832 Transcript_26555/m.66832 type:complete len:203 (+) Transcript_26555:417-1025(+)